VAAYFFDSSALVKRYVNETGTAWVIGITDPAVGPRLYIAGITGVEVVSAVRRKLRGGHVSATDAAAAIARFRHDFANEFRVIELTPSLVSSAMALAEKHFLRGYDAVQLAVALSTHAGRAALNLSALSLISADKDLTVAGAVEGLITDDPNNH